MKEQSSPDPLVDILSAFVRITLQLLRLYPALDLRGYQRNDFNGLEARPPVQNLLRLLVLLLPLQRQRWEGNVEVLLEGLCAFLLVDTNLCKRSEFGVLDVLKTLEQKDEAPLLKRPLRGRRLQGS